MDARDLMNRYLFAVGERLPDDRRDDIVAELSDSMQSQVEEREATLGRPLTLEEAAGVLREYGPPVLAASRYAQQRSLIGSMLYPFYVRTLRVTLCIALGLFLLGVAIGVVTTGEDPLVAFAQFWGVALGGLIIVAGVVTTVFAAIERFGGSDALVRAWNPRTLRPAGDGQWVPRSESIFATRYERCDRRVAARCAIRALTCGERVPRWRGNTTGRASAHVAPVVRIGMLILLASVLIQVALDMAMLIRPDWARLRAGVLALTNGSIGIAALALSPLRPLVLSTPNYHHHNYADALRLANVVIGWSLVGVGVVGLIGAVCYARRFVRLGSGETNGPLTVQSTAAR